MQRSQLCFATVALAVSRHICLGMRPNFRLNFDFRMRLLCERENKLQEISITEEKYYKKDELRRNNEEEIRRGDYSRLIFYHLCRYQQVSLILPDSGPCVMRGSTILALERPEVMWFSMFSVTYFT